MRGEPPHDSRQQRRGFSLLELLAVVTIIGVLAALVLPRIATSTDNAKQAGATQYRADLNAALENYFFETNRLPKDLETLYTSGYYSEPIPVNPVTNLPFQLDATTGRVRVD